jgi:hypothetical protein
MFSYTKLHLCQAYVHIGVPTCIPSLCIGMFSYTKLHLCQAYVHIGVPTCIPSLCIGMFRYSLVPRDIHRSYVCRLFHTHGICSL